MTLTPEEIEQLKADIEEAFDKTVEQAQIVLQLQRDNIKMALQILNEKQNKSEDE